MLRSLLAAVVVFSLVLGACETGLAQAPRITPDVVYGHKFGLALTMDVFAPKQDANGAGVLFMVSGGWYSRWSDPAKAQRLFEPLTSHGFTVFAVRHGSSPRFTIPEAVEDVRRSVRFIRLNADRFKVDSDRLGVYGASAGGHLSLMLATASDDGDPDAQDPVLRTSDRVSAVVAWVAPTDLRIMVWDNPDHLPAYNRFPALELPLKEAQTYSPMIHVTPDDPPTLLVVGDQDTLVPMQHSENILKALQKQNVASKLVVLEGAGHGFTGEYRVRARDELVAWFEKHLSKEPR